VERIRMIEYKGKTILLEDFSNLQPGPEFYMELEKAEQLIRRQPPKSVLTLFDATNSSFDAGVLTALKNFVKGNTPFVKYSAVVGIKGLKEIGLASVSKAAGRPLELCDTREEALDFLAKLE
jgi:hypothetical protein